MTEFNKKVNQDIDYFDRLSEIEGNYSLNRIYHLHSNSNLNRYSSIEIKEYWEKLAQDVKNKKKYGIIDLYVHVPFCQDKCLYCNSYSKKISTDKEVESYIDYMTKNMKFFHNPFSDIKFNTLYIGGGTPSILSLKQLNKLLSKLFSSFDFKENSCLTFEFNPLSISCEKLDLIKKFNFNRISFGIQTFDKQVLSKMNRNYRSYYSIKKIIEYAKKIGFKHIDADLIIDLKGQNSSIFLENFYKAVKLGLSEIDVYSLFPTKGYLNSYFGGDLTRFHENQKKTIIEVSKYIKDIAEKFDYEPSEFSLSGISWAFYKKEPILEKIKSNLSKEEKMYNRYKSKKAGLNPDGYSFLGLGPSARSHIYGYLSYTNLCEEYLGKFDQDSKGYIGTPLSIKEEMVRYIIGSITKSSKVSLKFFKERFNSELIENFDYAVKALQMLKKIQIDKGYLYFLPTDQKERFVYSMFFLSKDYLRLLESSQSILSKNQP